MLQVQSSRQKGQFKKLTAVIMMAALAFASCSRYDSIEHNTITLYPIINSAIEPQISTRAASDYVVYSGHRQNIYAHAVAYSGDTHLTDFDANGWFLPDLDHPGRWFSRVNVHSGKSYNLYCYTSMPVDEGSMPTFTYSGSSKVTLTFSGFDIITTIDPLVTTASMGKLLCDDQYLESQDYPVLTDQSFGKFDIGTVESGTYNNHPATTKVFLALDHLFAKATLSFKVADRYNSIRTIELLEATISTESGNFTGTHTYSFVDRKFTLDPQGLFYTKHLSIDLIDENETVELGSDPTELGWFCFLPHNDFPHINLSVRYNVYDKKGNLVRENCTATNANLINISEPIKGTNYNITVNIAPTYLYQLSDDDVELELTIE